MLTRSIGGLAAIAFFFGCSAGVLADNDACWQLLYHAVERSASAPHSPFISYGETISITQDGQRYERASAHVVYRDDGLAYVDDDRWVHPFMSSVLEPGPPVLGPYGSNRSSWLSFISSGTAPFPIIADTHNPALGRCSDAGDEILDGNRAAHLVFPDAPADRPGLKSIWIDRSTFNVRRAVVSLFLTFVYDTSGKRGERLVDYTIQVARQQGYTIVRQVNWQYTYQVFSQQSTISAEYRFDDFQFDSKPPLGTLFAAASPSGGER
jgi:hypothetical protein